MITSLFLQWHERDKNSVVGKVLDVFKTALQNVIPGKCYIHVITVIYQILYIEYIKKMCSNSNLNLKYQF